MSIPSPAELVERYGVHPPERLAGELGFCVTRAEAPPMLPGVTVMSEYQPRQEIILYLGPIRQAAATRGESSARFEQWHIAHELYHALAETRAISAWRVRETEADMWADELMTLVGKALS
ncbi:MAG: hypothetical protein ACYDCO_18910 [Armatimonadota bacterium]